MTDLLQTIDDYTLARYSALKLKLFGFCEIMHKTANNSDQPVPVTIPKREQVSLDDRYDLITWLRWESPAQYSENKEWSFGSSDATYGEIIARVVLAHKVQLGENLVFDFANKFPQILSVPGYTYVFMDDSFNIDPDHEKIYLTELGKTVYEKHRFNWNLYVVNFTFQFIPCDSDSFRILENGEFRITE